MRLALLFLSGIVAIGACGGPDRDPVLPVAEPTTADAGPPEAAAAPVATTPSEPAAEADAGSVAEMPTAAPTDFDAGAFIATPATADVFIALNEAAMRKHPVAGRAGPILAQLPVFADLARSSIDPISNTDWAMTWGASLAHLEQGTFVVQTNIDDASIERAVEAAAKRNSVRAFLHPQTKLVVSVHRTHATAATTEFKARRPKDPNPKEALRVVLKQPGKRVSIPSAQLADITEMRATLVLKESDGSGDVRVEADCTDAKKAAAAVTELNDAIKRGNTLMVKIATRGLVDKAAFAVEGNRAVMKLAATQEQLEAVLNVMAAVVGATIQPAKAPATP